MRILGIDPGTQIMGYAIIDAKGDDVTCVHVGAIKLQRKSLPERLLEIGEFTKSLLIEYSPKALSLEQIFLGKNVDSAFKLGHARGVIMVEALRAHCEVFEYANRAVKKAITGNGASEKEQLAQTLMMLLKLKSLPQPVDASDALAMAYHHAQEVRRLRLIQRAVEI
ncbi:MAG: crossover junction endodeoxyribonuclease RuvC [Bdellovibrionota bacterium]